MNRILQCRKVPILAPRRFFHPKRVGKIGEIKEILRVKIHSLKEAEKNFILNHRNAYSSFRNAFDLAFMLSSLLTVGYITFISDVKLEKLENLACRLLDYLGCERLRAIIQDYTIVGTVIAMQLITPIPRNLVSIVLFQPLAEWAGSSQKRIKQLRVFAKQLQVFAGLCFIIGLAICHVNYARYAVQSSESFRMRKFYRSVKRMRDRKEAYEIALDLTIEAENYKDDFDQIWNLDDEIFNQIDIHSTTEDIKTQIHRLQNTVTETTQDE